MTDRITLAGRARIDKTGRFSFKNVSGESMPAFACFKLNAYDGTNDYFDAVKPDGEGSLYFVNGPTAVAVNAFGEGRLWGIASQIGMTTSTTFGEAVGPVNASWNLESSGSGFVVFSSPSGGIAAIVKEGGSNRKQVRMMEDLFAAVNTRTDPSTAIARVFRRNIDGDLVLTMDEILIVNRFQHISVDAGKYAKAEWIDGEWQLYAADCPSDSSSGSII